jgi:hypothetical protein
MLARGVQGARPAMPWVDALANTLVITRVRAGQSRAGVLGGSRCRIRHQLGIAYDQDFG